MILIFGDKFNGLIKENDEITLLGYYGMDNFGDDLMLKSIIEDFLSKKLKINILAYREISWINSKEFPNVRVLKWPDGKIAKLKFFRRAVKNSSIVAWGGGTCFTDEDGDGYFKYMMYTKLIGKKVAYLGVGIGNLNRNIRKIKTISLVNISDVLAFRERESLNKAIGYYKFKDKEKLYLVEDPAHKILREMSQKLEVKIEDILILAWRDLEKYAETTIGNSYDNIIQFSKHVCNEYNINKIIVIDTDSIVDTKISLKLVDLLKEGLSIEVVYEGTKSYKEKLDILSKGKIILTSRLHIAVAAKYLQKKCFVYNYSPKIKYYVEEINDENIKLIEENFSITL